MSTSHESGPATPVPGAHLRRGVDQVAVHEEIERLLELIDEAEPATGPEQLGHVADVFERAHGVLSEALTTVEKA